MYPQQSITDHESRLVINESARRPLQATKIPHIFSPNIYTLCLHHNNKLHFMQNLNQKLWPLYSKTGHSTLSSLVW